MRTGELLEASTYYPNGARETFLADEEELGEETLTAPEVAGFTGKEGDEEVGLVYFGERYLIPRLGRWASPDPLHVHAVGGGEALNSYHYVSGNLLSARDPLGLQESLRVTGLQPDPSGTGTRIPRAEPTYGSGLVHPAVVAETTVIAGVELDGRPQTRYDADRNVTVVTWGAVVQIRNQSIHYRLPADQNPDYTAHQHQRGPVGQNVTVREHEEGRHFAFNDRYYTQANLNQRVERIRDAEGRQVDPFTIELPGHATHQVQREAVRRAAQALTEWIDADHDREDMLANDPEARAANDPGYTDQDRPVPVYPSDAPGRRVPSAPESSTPSPPPAAAQGGSTTPNSPGTGAPEAPPPN